MRRPCSLACGSWKAHSLLMLRFHTCLLSCKISSTHPLCLPPRHLLQTYPSRNTRIPLLVLVVTKWWLATSLPPTSILAISGGSTMKSRQILLALLCPITRTSLGAGKAVKKFYVANLLNVSKAFIAPKGWLMIGIALICPHSDVGSGSTVFLSVAGLVRLSLRKTRLFIVIHRVCSLMDCLELWLSGITMLFLCQV